VRGEAMLERKTFAESAGELLADADDLVCEKK
jgi:hypothetical protein